jgi:hypothetical protein
MVSVALDSTLLIRRLDYVQHQSQVLTHLRLLYALVEGFIRCSRVRRITRLARCDRQAGIGGAAREHRKRGR